MLCVYLPDCTHFRQVINCLKSVIDTLSKKSSEFPVIEYLERTSWWDFTYRAWVKPMTVVAVAGLNKNC